MVFDNIASYERNSKQELIIYELFFSSTQKDFVEFL